VTHTPNPSKLATLKNQKRSLSFDGCSWLMVFHLGVASALVDRYNGTLPHAQVLFILCVI